jgi:hypothetical protein
LGDWSYHRSGQKDRLQRIAFRPRLRCRFPPKWPGIRAFFERDADHDRRMTVSSA